MRGFAPRADKDTKSCKIRQPGKAGSLFRSPGRACGRRNWTMGRGRGSRAQKKAAPDRAGPPGAQKKRRRSRRDGPRVRNQRNRVVSPKKQGRRTIPGRRQRGYGPDRSENDAGEKNVGKKDVGKPWRRNGQPYPTPASHAARREGAGAEQPRAAPASPPLRPPGRGSGKKGSFGKPAAGGGMRRRYAFS